MPKGNMRLTRRSGTEECIEKLHDVRAFTMVDPPSIGSVFEKTRIELSAEHLQFCGSSGIGFLSS